MTSLSIAGFYARRAFETAAEAKSLDKWRSQLHLLAEVPEDSISRHCRGLQAVDDDRYPAGLSSEVMEFACGLVEQGRLPLRGDVAREYDALLDDYYGIRRAGVVTATHLDEEGRLLIARRLREATGSTFVLDATVDPSIIGGVVLKIGDRVIDRSVRASLNSLRCALLDNCGDEQVGDEKGA